MHKILFRLALPLLSGGLALCGPAAHGAASDAEPSPGVMRTRVEPAPQTQRMAELAQALSPETEAVWLETNSDRTLTLYLPAAQPEPLGALILLPDEHRHPDWPSDLHPLRVGLPEHGWDSLAVALPAPPPAPVPERTFGANTGSAAEASASAATADLNAGTTTGAAPPLETYEERVMNICEAAIRHLESRGRQYLILLGSGSGAAWAAQCAERFQDSRPLGLVLLDPQRIERPGAPDLDGLLPDLSLPVLDLYRPPLAAQGVRGDPARLRARIAARAALAQYHQGRLPALSPDDGDWLVREVRGRIERYLMPQEAPEPEPEAVTDQRPGG